MTFVEGLRLSSLELSLRYEEYRIGTYQVMCSDVLDLAWTDWADISCLLLVTRGVGGSGFGRFLGIGKHYLQMWFAS